MNRPVRFDHDQSVCPRKEAVIQMIQYEDDVLAKEAENEEPSFEEDQETQNDADEEYEGEFNEISSSINSSQFQTESTLSRTSKVLSVNRTASQNSPEPMHQNDMSLFPEDLYDYYHSVVQRIQKVFAPDGVWKEKSVKFYFTVQICTCIYRCILACTCILANRFRVNKAKSYSERVAYCSYIVHNKTSIQQTDSSFRNLLLFF